MVREVMVRKQRRQRRRRSFVGTSTSSSRSFVIMLTTAGALPVSSSLSAAGPIAPQPPPRRRHSGCLPLLKIHRFITCGDEVNIHQHNRSGEQSDLYNKKAEAMPSSALINNKAKVQFADLPEVCLPKRNILQISVCKKLSYLK
uniref:Uncharacterized protein n=1 Tax=Oryza barthii TaxID=65489 RepID=A0A0D3HV45_9ORYZ